MPEPSASTVHNAFALQGSVILSEARLPAAKSNVILSEASRSLIARGAVEGPANLFAPATPSMVSNHRIYA